MTAALPATTQAPLLEAAAAERRRRAERRRDLSPGQLVLLPRAAAHAAGLAPGDRLAFVLERTAARGKIKVESALSRKQVEVDASGISPALQPGDRAPNGAVAVQVRMGDGDVDPDIFCAGPRAAAPGSDLPECSWASASALPTPPTGAASWPDVAPARNSLGAGDAVALRGCDGSARSIGPGGLLPDFEVVQPYEPGRIRPGVRSATCAGRGEAVLVDFLGGASLWVWRDLLTRAVEIGVGDDSLEDARGVWASEALVEQCRPGASPAVPSADAASLAAARRAALPPQPAAGVAPALTSAPSPLAPSGEKPAMSLSPSTQTLFCAPRAFPSGSLVQIPRDYAEQARPALSEIEGTLGQPRRPKAWEELGAAIYGDDGDAIARPGFYPVLEVVTISWSTGEALPLVVLDNPAAEDPEEKEIFVLAALVQPAGALVPAGEPLAPVKAARGLAAAASSAVKRGARSAGALALSEGRRKAKVVAEEIGGDAILGAHDQVKGVASGLLRAFGLDKLIPAATLGLDFAATSGARMLGEALAPSSPKIAETLTTIGNVIERKQGQRTAQAVGDAVRPMLGAIGATFGEAAGRALAPALQAVGALPPASVDEVEAEAEEEEPTPTAKRKKAKAAKRTPARRAAKAAEPTEVDGDDAEDDQ